MEPSAQQVPQPNIPESPVTPQPQISTPTPVPPHPNPGKGRLILLGALLIIIGGFIAVVIVSNATSNENPYATSQQAIAKAAEELQQSQITPTPLSERDQKLKEIDTDLTNIDQENQEIDQGLKDSLPDLSI